MAHRDWSNSGSLYGSKIGPLLTWFGCVSWCSYGTTNSGDLTLLLTFGTLFLLLGCLVQLWYEGMCLSYYSLLYPVHLISLVCLLFSKGKWRRSGSGEEERWRQGTGQRGGRGNWDYKYFFLTFHFHCNIKTLRWPSSLHVFRRMLV